MMNQVTGLTWGLCVILGLGTDQPARDPGELTDPMEILKRADAAIKKVDRVSYNADYKATEWITAFVPAVTGKVVMGERSKHDIDRFFCQVKLQSAKSSETSEYTAGSDGDVFFVIDPKTKTAHQDMDPAVLGSEARNIQRVLLREFSAPDPFDDELKAEEIELKGSKPIGDEMCYEVYVKAKDAPPAMVWHFSTTDFLPRRVTRIYKNDEGQEGTTELTLSDLVVNPKSAKDPFKLTVPPGFKKTDEFAP